MNRKFYLALGMLLVGGLLIFLWNFSRPSTPAGAGASTTGFSSVSQKKTTLSRFFASSGVSSSAQDHALTEKPTAWAQAKLAASNSSAPSSSAKAQTASDPRGLPYADSFPREVLPSGTNLKKCTNKNFNPSDPRTW